MPNNNETPVKFSVLDWNAEVRKIWGPEWNAPEVEYEWSNGKKHTRRTEESAIYDRD